MLFNKPLFNIAPLKVGLTWESDPDYFYEEKIDGKYTEKDFGDSLLIGETKDGKFYAFDIVIYMGKDIRKEPLHRRLAILNRFAVLRPENDWNGGCFLAKVIARGGEGVIRKSIYGEFGFDWTKCKRLERFFCKVTKIGAGQSVEIKDEGTGQPRGKVSLFGGKCDKVRIGSILKIEGFGLTAKGFIREARPCKDTPTSWLAKY